MQKYKEEPLQQNQSVPIQLSLRDSVRNSNRFSQSFDFSNIQAYQDQIEISASMLKEFDVVKSSYRGSITNIEHVQSPKKQPLTPQKFPRQYSLENQQYQVDMSKSGLKSIQKLYNQSQLQINQTPVYILVILLSKEEIQSVSSIDETNKEIQIKILKRKILDKYAALALFIMKKSEINNFSFKYKVTKPSFILFSKTQEKTFKFQHLIVHEQAGFLCKQITQDSSEQLVNSCIIEGHQYLVKYLEQLEKLNISIFQQFQLIFKKHFKAYSKSNQVVFRSIAIDKNNSLFSQFFLYFIFIIYRQGALQKLREYNLYQKLRFNRSSIPKFMNRKRYAYYQNGQYLKQFALYAIFSYGCQVFSQNLYTFLEVVKCTITQLSPLNVKSIFSKLQKLQNNKIMIDLLQTPNINAIFIANQEISFIQYFEAMLKYCEATIPHLRSQGKFQQMTDLLLNLFVKLASKNRVTRLTQEEKQALPNFEKRITCLFKHKSEYNLQVKRLGQIYMQIKGLYQLTPKLAEMFLKVLKTHIFNHCEVLLKYFFTSIIYPLVILPQIAEQTSVLIDFFMKQQVQTQNIIVVIKLLLESNTTIFNYQTIQFVLKKFIKQNPFINEFRVQLLKKCIVNWSKGQRINTDRINFLFTLLQLLETKKGLMSDEQTFSSQINEIKACLRQ